MYRRWQAQATRGGLQRSLDYLAQAPIQAQAQTPGPGWGWYNVGEGIDGSAGRGWGLLCARAGDQRPTTSDQRPRPESRARSARADG